MDKATLVTSDLAVGDELVKALDEASLPPTVALWVHLPEYGDWRFALASPALDNAQPAAAYGLVHKALKSANMPPELTPTLSIFRMSDPFIKDLRRIFGKTKSVRGMRLGGQLIGDRFLEDAIAYRIR